MWKAGAAAPARFVLLIGGRWTGPDPGEASGAPKLDVARFPKSPGLFVLRLVVARAPESLEKCSTFSREGENPRERGERREGSEGDIFAEDTTCTRSRMYCCKCRNKSVAVRA